MHWNKGITLKMLHGHFSDDTYELGDLDDVQLEEVCDCLCGTPNDPPECDNCDLWNEINRRRNSRCGRDVFHDGSIIDGGGVSRPEWMDDDQWGEYRMSAEYAHEVSHVSDSVFDEPDYDDR